MGKENVGFLTLIAQIPHRIFRVELAGLYYKKKIQIVKIFQKSGIFLKNKSFSKYLNFQQNFAANYNMAFKKKNTFSSVLGLIA